MPMVIMLKPMPARVKITVNTRVDKPKIKAKVPTIEKRSFQAFMLFHYSILQCLFRRAYNFYAITQLNRPETIRPENSALATLHLPKQ